MLARKNEVIKDAFDYLQIISKDEENRMAYEARQAWLMDQCTREKVAREEGKAEEKLNITKNLLSMGMSTKDIAKVTGLSVDEVEKLK